MARCPELPRVVENPCFSTIGTRRAPRRRKSLFFKGEKEFDTIPILVRKGHRIVGRVTHPDVYGGGYKNDQLPIKKIMKPAPAIIPYITPETIVKEMLKKMRWDCIILQKKGEYVGLITYWDLF